MVMNIVEILQLGSNLFFFFKISNVCKRAYSLEAESLDIILGRSTIFIGYFYKYL